MSLFSPAARQQHRTGPGFGGGQPKELWVGERPECGTHMDTHTRTDVDKGCAL